ncbi:MAG: condensation domain-containing protein [Promethearchaeota archaeon]
MQKRKLNEIEHLNWLIGQPYNISMVITIKGHLEIDLFKESLEKVQKKHPILQARLDLNEEGRPYLIFGVNGLIPVEIIPRIDDDLGKKIVDEEFDIPFEIGIDCSSPLIRVKLLISESISDIIITIAHVIADGMSMIYLFRDLIFFMASSKKRIKPLKVIMNAENILPHFYRRKIPKTARKFKFIVWLIKKLITLRKFIRKVIKKQLIEEKPGTKDKNQRRYITRDWVLTEEQSQLLIRKCKNEGVTVHSALCTMFLPDFPAIYNPVDLRKKLAYPVGESVGLYAGRIEVKAKYKTKSSFWNIAREYQEKLVKGLNSDEVFKVFKLITRAVPFELFAELMSLETEQSNRIWITNLGSLDKFNEFIASKGFTIKMLYGGVSPTYEAIFVPVFTIDKKIHFQLHCLTPPHTEEEIEKYINNSLKQLSKAINN